MKARTDDTRCGTLGRGRLAPATRAIRGLLFLFSFLALPLFADVYLINGERVEGEVHDLGNGQRTLCNDTKCFFLPADAVRVDEGAVAPVDEAVAPVDEAVAPVDEAVAPVDEASRLVSKEVENSIQSRRDACSTGRDACSTGRDACSTDTSRLAQGYMKPAELLAFLRNAAAPAEDGPFAGKSVWAILVLVLLGGLAMNLTPCVLPMVPINLMIIGRSATRGALYGLGIALAYGTLGVLAAVGGMAFGAIQGSPWFNLVIAALFLCLGLSLLGVFFIDFSKRRGALAQKKATMWPGLFAFFMGVVSAVLAGACVAPILIAVLLLTAKLYAGGVTLALGLPFVLGLGMALPWPFAGAGLKVLPKPGAWMTWVNKAFGVLVLGFAAWYGYLAYLGFAAVAPVDEASRLVSKEVENSIQSRRDACSTAATPATFSLEGLRRPVFVDCWATWCKNCAAMEHTTFTDPDVARELKNFTVIKLQAEDMTELKKLPGFGDVMGLPAFVIFE